MRDLSVLLGLSLVPPIYSASPKKPAKAREPLKLVDTQETISQSLGDTYTLLEEWGLWSAALSVVQGVGTPRARAGFFIDDDTAIEIDKNLAACKRRDPDGSSNFEVIRLIYVRRMSYRDVSRITGINSALIKGIIDKYAFWLDSKIYDGDHCHQLNVKRVLDSRLKKKIDKKD